MYWGGRKGHYQDNLFKVYLSQLCTLLKLNIGLLFQSLIDTERIFLPLISTIKLSKIYEQLLSGLKI